MKRKNDKLELILLGVGILLLLLLFVVKRRLDAPEETATAESRTETMEGKKQEETIQNMEQENAAFLNSKKEEQKETTAFGSPQMARGIELLVPSPVQRFNTAVVWLDDGLAEGEGSFSVMYRCHAFSWNVSSKNMVPLKSKIALSMPGSFLYGGQRLPPRFKRWSVPKNLKIWQLPKMRLATFSV